MWVKLIYYKTKFKENERNTFYNSDNINHSEIVKTSKLKEVETLDELSKLQYVLKFDDFEIIQK